MVMDSQNNQTNTHFCSTCGTKIPDNMRFCPVCGSPNQFNQTNIQENNYQAQQNYTQMKKAKKKFATGFIIPVLILSAIFLTVSLGASVYYIAYGGYYSIFGLLFLTSLSLFVTSLLFSIFSFRKNSLFIVAIITFGVGFSDLVFTALSLLV